MILEQTEIFDLPCRLIRDQHGYHYIEIDDYVIFYFPEVIQLRDWLSDLISRWPEEKAQRDPREIYDL